MSEDEEFIEDEQFDEEYEEKRESKRRINLNDTGRKILTFSIIVMVSFSAGCAVVGFSMLASENSARKDLSANNLYLATIIDGFDVTVFNTTSEQLANYIYTNDSITSTFEDIGGDVTYNDAQVDLEYMVIFFYPYASEMSIQKITFHINEKSQLNIIVFADGREVYNAMKIKTDIVLDFLLFASEISVYVF